MEKEATMEEKSEGTPPPVDPAQSPEARCALMLLGRRAQTIPTTTTTTATVPPVQKQKLTVAFLRNKVLADPDGSYSTADADDQAFLASTSIRLDSCNVHAIENLEMLDKLTHVHLQNNFIQTIEELDFVRNLQWLNLSKNQIKIIQGLSHLKSLTCLDLSANVITDIDHITDHLPTNSLRIFNLYGNPVANTKNYRTFITSALPKLLALDGTCLCEDPKNAPGFTADDELFGCDGSSCNARVIFGPRFVTGSINGSGESGESGQGGEGGGSKGGEEERDYCVSCAYRNVEQAVKENGGRLDGHGFVLSTDVGVTPFHSINHGEKRAGKDDVISMLRKSAMETRIELRNIRDDLLMKIRSRRIKTSNDAEKRMNLLKRLDDHIAEKDVAEKEGMHTGIKKEDGVVVEGKEQEEEGQKYSKK